MGDRRIYDPSKLHHQAPIVIAGVGGSGTRVVATCLQGLGAFVGHDLNRAVDDWWFTFLLRRPLWYQSVYQDEPAEIAKYIKLHRELMISQRAMSRAQWEDIRQAQAHFLAHNHKANWYWHYGGKWVEQRIRMIENREPVDLDDYTCWGWKSPIAHIYLPELKQEYPQMRYIHVIRNGLDMAYSTNQKQARCWSWLFGAPYPASRDDRPRASLDYWVRANRRAIKFCHHELANQHLIMRFEDLYQHPAREIQRIAEFIGVPVAPATLARLALIPRAPQTVGRYQQHRLGVFGDELLNEVKQLGYEGVPAVAGMGRDSRIMTPWSKVKRIPRRIHQEVRRFCRLLTS